MNQGLATTIAAIIAALVSIVTLVVSSVVASRSEVRAAHREVLAPYLEKLSENLYTIVAAVVVMRKRSLANQDVGEWQTRAKEAGKLVDDTRRKVRYFLPGLEEALRELILASDHIATIAPIPGDHADKLVRGYQWLCGRVDSSIRASYRRRP
jgi:ABC-type nickel/cobalt efflux system permease component RcnA